MTVSNGDLFLLNRNGTDYSVSWEKIFADIDSNITIGDGKITVQDYDGTEIGSFTTNQAGNGTITLPQVVIPESLHPKGFINVSEPAPSNPEHGDLYVHTNEGGGEVVADASFGPGITGTVEEGVFVIFGIDDKWHSGGQSNPTQVQSDWTNGDSSSPAFIKNKPNIESIVDSRAGDGEIEVNAGVGLIATGQNGSANQTSKTTRVLAVNAGDGISIDSDGKVVIDPSFNLDGNVTAPNDGKLTIKNSDGSTAAEFTADQAGNSEVTLPAGFSGDYGDLNNKPNIGNGTLTLKTSDGTKVGDFTANQGSSEEWVLPASATVNDGQLQLQDPSGTTKYTFSANQAGNQPVAVYLKDGYIQNLPSLS